MKRSNYSLIIAALLLLPAAASVADAGKPEPLVIVVKKGSKTTDLSSADLLKIFKGQTKAGPDGTKYFLTMRSPGSPERAAFLDEVMKMSEQEYQKYFLQAVFTGLMKAPPKAVSGVDALKSTMDANDGAIGYVKLSDVDDTMQVVTIDGKKPADPGYPLSLK